MRSSRSSICLINTRCPRHEDVFAPFIAALETGDEIIVRYVFQKLLADALLDVTRRFQALLLEELQIQRDDDSTSVRPNMNSRTIDPPFRDNTIAVEPTLQGPGGLAVVIRVVAADDGSKL